MLEIKQATLSVAGKVLLKDLSFVAPDGRITCVVGPCGCGKTALLEAFMGLRPVDEGYITVNGELLSPLSAATFRNMMAYVPQAFQFGEQRVCDLFDTLASLRWNSADCSHRNLMEEWQRLGVDESCYNLALHSLMAAERQRIFLSFAGLLHRPMVLLDEPTALQTAETWQATATYIQELARRGAVVLTTTADRHLTSIAEQLIELHPNE